LVSLVGAGPGGADYLTLKGLRRLKQADVVFHDALVCPEVLAFAEDAECIEVGKRGGRASTPQEVIDAAMIAASRRGLRVVRLKGGDPFVFGRGGEEAIALAGAQIPFEIVPGVSSAIAAPALAGIPVTHRGLASALLIVNGALPDDLSRVVGGVTPGSMTLVVMMGLRNRTEIAGVLIEHGWSAATPAAVVVGAATDGEWHWRGTLDELESVVIPAACDRSPGTLVIGAVAALSLRTVNSPESPGVEHVCA
jgi:uroporphyrin-III C-methyltransferase/precorrin-2 dehydrogenase/sirohydrochlorin ferrochelatase